MAYISNKDDSLERKELPDKPYSQIRKLRLGHSTFRLQACNRDSEISICIPYMGNRVRNNSLRDPKGAPGLENKGPILDVE